jgi:hypothetical protein
MMDAVLHKIHRNAPPGVGGMQIADVIARGELGDWLELRDLALADSAIFQSIFRLVKSTLAQNDPELEGRSSYMFWYHWCQFQMSAKRPVPNG